jgi:hypothetical protein
MVEEAASAAQAMQDEAHHLSRAISVFKLGTQTHQAPQAPQLAGARTLGLAYPH